MDDLISRQAAIEAIENTEWYHLRNNGVMMRGANSKEHQAWYKEQDIYKALEQLPSAQQRWIPCNERLPEPRVAVLGYAPKFKNIFALYYDSVMGWMVWSPIRDDCLPNSQGDIIAWMPLPEPYAERRIDEVQRL